MEVDPVYKTVEDKFGFERINETGILTETKRMLMDQNPKNMELRFSNKISQPTLTCHEIKGEGNTCVEVVLFDTSTGKKVEVGVGPVASAGVEFFVLGQGTDDCTGEGFDEKIVRVEGNKLPLLTVNQCQLQGGSCVLEGVTFRHHATKVKPTVFRLGARIVGTFDGIIVKEAKTESFPVKCYRKKYTMKKEIPNPRDKISVLKNIQRRGKIEERLQAQGIDTVEKFLIRHLINPGELKNIALSNGKKWEDTINHARKCQCYKMYWYLNTQENSGVVFDIFGELKWMYSQGEYAATNMLSENNKVDADKLLSSALERWEDVTSFDDPDSLQQQPSNPLIPGQYPGMNYNAGAAETVDGSWNNIEAPDPSLNQGIPVSDMNRPLSVRGSFGEHDFALMIDDIYSPLDQLFSQYWI